MKKFLNQFEEVHGRIYRIHFKSLGSLLNLQETIAQRCFLKWDVALDLHAAPSPPQGAPTR
jgi:hypothetical protein